jgi:hypothetical protein
MLETIALVFSSIIFGGGAMYSGIYAFGRVQYWKALYEQSVEDFEEVLSRAERAEKTAQAVSSKYVDMVEIVRAQMERPIVAALSDAHVQQIASTLSQLVINTQGPNRIN